MKNWKIRYLNVLPVLVIAFLLCKLIFTTNISMSGILSSIYSCVAYFVYGLIISYFLNPLLVMIERNIVKETDNAHTKVVKRRVSILVIYLLVIAFLTIFVMNIAPAIATGINDFVRNLPAYLEKSQAYVSNAIAIFNPSLAKTVQNDLSGVITAVYEWFGGQTDVSKVGDVVTTAVSGSAKTVIRLVFGVVVSIYFLYGKEKFALHLKRLVYALFQTERADTIMEYARATNKIFFDFLISKLVQAFVIFILGLCILIPFKVPLAPLISLLLALTNMIPYIGPWLGGIPSVVLAFLYAPVKGLVVLLFIIGMQIIDNLFIGPKVVADRVGISPVLVIAGVAIGGTMGGVVGMFLGVPIVAVIKLVFYDRFIEKRLKEKNLKI